MYCNGYLDEMVTLLIFLSPADKQQGKGQGNFVQLNKRHHICKKNTNFFSALLTFFSSPAFLYLRWLGALQDQEERISQYRTPFPETRFLLLIKTLTRKSFSQPEFQKETEIPVRKSGDLMIAFCVAFQLHHICHLMVRPLTQVVVHRPIISVSRTRSAVRKIVGINRSQRKEKA